MNECHDCTHYGIPYCTHIEGTLSVQVGLKMATMRPKHVAKNRQVVALNIMSFIIVVYDVKIYMLIFRLVVLCEFGTYLYCFCLVIVISCSASKLYRRFGGPGAGLDE
jgi:hypothetical protein